VTNAFVGGYGASCRVGPAAPLLRRCAAA